MSGEAQSRRKLGGEPVYSWMAAQKNMAKVHVTKISAAQRQIDASIRLLFSGEDSLAVHTITAAAHGIVRDLAKQRKPRLVDNLYEVPLKSVHEQLSNQMPSDDAIHREFLGFKKWLRSYRNRPANFLKHANQDAGHSLNADTLDTDSLLLEACVQYSLLGFELTPEMQAFAWWHLAVYPSEESDKFETAVGHVHELTRHEQIEFGAFLLTLISEKKS